MAGFLLRGVCLAMSRCWSDNLSGVPPTTIRQLGKQSSAIPHMRSRRPYHDTDEVELFKLVVSPLFCKAIALILLGTVEQVKYWTLAQCWAREAVRAVPDHILHKSCSGIVRSERSQPWEMKLIFHSISRVRLSARRSKWKLSHLIASALILSDIQEARPRLLRVEAFDAAEAISLHKISV